jgi:ferrous iron transport protein A
MKLRDCNVGAKVKIITFAQTGHQYRQKLLSMGLSKGVDFTILRKAPLGDPMEIRIGQSNISLRKAEADSIEVEEVRS